ncbi:MAG: oxidoreductase [Gammaproteobacteria bacterium]|nr:oxidoreductase [Gammaproteobacteria bacterium]
MNSLLIWPVALPLIGSMVALVWPRRSGLVATVAMLATLAASLAVVRGVAEHGVLQHALGGWQPGLGIALRADVLSAALLLMSALVALAASVYATHYFADPHRQARFWPLWLMLVTALHALFLSGDLFNLYVTLELLGLAAVALAALGASRASLQAALRYLTFGLLGSLAFLTGVALLYGAYGTLDMPQLAGQVDPQPAARVALVLMTGGLLIKAALFPLHFWLPPAHANAPAPVSAALSALVVKASFYLVLRLWLDVFDGVPTATDALLLGLLGAMAVIWGSWRALRAERLKLLAAYSTVAQVGYLFLFLPLLLAMPVGPPRDALFAAMVLFALTHGFAKSAFFLAAGVVQMHAGHDRIAELGGVARMLPVTVFALALAGVALIGLPPSGTFLAKWQLMSAAIAWQQWPWLLVIAVGSLLAGGYVFRVLGHAFAPGEGVGPSLALSRAEIPALLLAITATLLLGLGAAAFWDYLAGGVAAAGVMQ